MVVVFAIISILAALTTAAVLKFMGTQPIANTRVMLKKTYVQMHRRWQEVTDTARRAPIQGVYLQAVLSLSSDAATQRVIFEKIMQKQSFPESYYEALHPIVIGSTSIPALQGYVQYLGGFGYTAANVTAVPKGYESSVCLLMALKRSPSGGTINDQDLGLAASVKTTIDPNGAPCLIDGWANAIGFCRWPLGNTNASAADPTDPGLLLWNRNNWSTGGSAIFASAIHAVTPMAPPVALPATANLTPVLASAGPQGNLLASVPVTPPASGVLTIGTPGSQTQWALISAANTQNNDVIYSNNLP